MDPIKTIIFDLDGTLFRTDTVFVEAMQQLCRQRELKSFDEDQLLKCIGKPSATVYKELFGDQISSDQLVEVDSELKSIQNDLINTTAELYTGVLEMLDTLKREGYTLCICTNGSKDYLNRVFSRFDLDCYFTIVKTRITGLEKHQLIRQILEECTSETAIFVGDTIVDFEAANRAMCLSIGVAYGYGGDEYLQSDFIATKPTDIIQIVNKVNGIYSRITEYLHCKKQKNQPLVVGINGVDTSGKSLFTKELSRFLHKHGTRCQVVSIDDFHNPSEIRNSETDPIMSYLNHAFDIPKLEREILKPISKDRRFNKVLMLLDLNTNTFTNRKQYDIDEETIVLVEGVLLFREPLTSYFDVRVFIDISFKEVLKRAEARDKAILGDMVIEKYNKKYIPIQKLYLQQHAPQSICHMIIDNRDFLKPLLHIKECL